MRKGLFVARFSASTVKVLTKLLLRCVRRNRLLSFAILLLAVYTRDKLKKPKVTDWLDIWKTAEPNSFNHNLRVDCDPDYHVGPYVFIETPTQGFFNQYLKLISSLHLARGFPGTVVFPQHCMSRTEYVDFYDTDWILVDSKSYFDINYLVRYWRKRDVTICQGSSKLNESSQWLNMVSFCKDIVPYKLRQLGLKRKPITEEYCNFAEWLYITPHNFTKVVVEYLKNTAQRTSLLKNDAITVTPSWNMLPLFYYRKSDAYLAFVRDTTLSLKLSQYIIDLGQEILSKVRAKQKLLNAESDPTVGVHARIEKDWYHRLSGLNPPETTLDRYKWKIKELMNRPGMVYIAVGDLDVNSSQLLSNWATVNYGERWIIKQTLKLEEKLKKIPLEAQAAVDFVVLTDMDYFLGIAFSSFDVVEYDFRAHTGRPSNLLDYVFHQFRPILNIRRCTF